MPRCHSVAILDHFLLQIGVFLVAICHFATAEHIATTFRRPTKRRRVRDIAWGDVMAHLKMIVAKRQRGRGIARDGSNQSKRT